MIPLLNKPGEYIEKKKSTRKSAFFDQDFLHSVWVSIDTDTISNSTITFSNI